jgi:hypothetical protein
MVTETYTIRVSRIYSEEAATLMGAYEFMRGKIEASLENAL